MYGAGIDARVRGETAVCSVRSGGQVRDCGAVGGEAGGAVVGVGGGAGGAGGGVAGGGCGADADAGGGGDGGGGEGADTGGEADDFVAYADGVFGGTPAGAEGAEVGVADAAVGDGYVDVGFFPGFGREGSPGEGGGGRVGEPAMEGCGWFGFSWLASEAGWEVGSVMMVLFDCGGW